MAGLTSCRREACTTALETYTPTQPPHTHRPEDRASTPCSYFHMHTFTHRAWWWYPHPLCFFQSCLLYPVVVKGGGWLHWPRFVILQVNITPITLTHTLNTLSAVFHTQTTCVMSFFAMNHVQQHTLGHQHVLLSEMYSISISELRYLLSTDTATNNDQISLISPQRTVCGCINTVMLKQNDNWTMKTNMFIWYYRKKEKRKEAHDGHCWFCPHHFIMYNICDRDIILI